MWNITIIDDENFVLELLKFQLQKIDDNLRIDAHSSVKGYIESTTCSDFIFLDIEMLPINGLDAIPIILNKCPEIKIIIHSSRDDDSAVFRSLQLGAVAYIHKHDFDQDLKYILEVIEKGGSFMTPVVAKKVIEYFQRPVKLMAELTPREKNVVEGLLDGLSYKMIADRHDISVDTVRMYIRSIYKKLNINSKAELFKLFSK